MDKQKTQSPAIFTRNFILVTFINMFVFFSFQMIFPTLPLYLRGLGSNDTVIGLIMGVFVVSSVLTRPFAGLALDKIGRRPVFMTGLVILIISSYLYGAFPVISSIVLVRLLHGMGWGIAATSTATIIAENVPKPRLGEGIGYFSLSNSLSMAIAPAMGLYLAGHYGFRDMFYVSAFLVVIAFVLSFLIRYRPYKPVKTDISKISLYEKSAWAPALIIFFVSVTWGGLSSFLPLYAMSKGITDIGYFFSCYAVAILLSRPLTGRLVDRYNYDIAVIPGLVCLFISVFWVSFAASLAEFLIIGFIYGLGFGAMQMSLQTMVVRHMPQNRLGAANATYFTGLDAGIGLGSTILGAVAGMIGYADMYMFAAFSLFVAFAVYVFYVRRNLIN